jgi:hypothetical protein
MAEIFDPFKPAPAAPGIADPFAPDYKAPTLAGEFRKGISSGVDALQGAGYGLAGLAGDALGAEGLKKWGLEGYQRNVAEQQANAPAVGRFEDIDSLKDAGLYAAQGLGQLAPFAASSLVTGGAGGILGRVAGSAAAKAAGERLLAEKAGEVAAGRMTQEAATKAAQEAAGSALTKSMVRGATAGAAANSIGTEQGLIYGDIYDQTGQTAPGTAALYGLGAGLLDVLPEVGLIGKLAGKQATKGIAREVLGQAGKEAATEGAQTVVERGAVSAVDPGKAVFSPEGISEIANAAVLGGLGGGVAGAGGKLLAGSAKPAAQPPQEQPAAEQAIAAQPLPDTGPLSRAANASIASGADQQAQAVQAESNEPAPAAPKQPPSGSFSNLADFENLVNAERADLAQRRSGIAQDQQASNEARLQEINRAVEYGRLSESERQRDAVMDQVFQRPETAYASPLQLRQAFAGALAQAGFNNPAPTEREAARLERALQARSAILQSERQAPPAGDFGQLAEFDNLLASEKTGLAARRAAMQRQQANQPTGLTPEKQARLDSELAAGWKPVGKRGLVSPSGKRHLLSNPELDYLQSLKEQSNGAIPATPAAQVVAQGGQAQGAQPGGGAGDGSPVHPGSGGRGTDAGASVPGVRADLAVRDAAAGERVDATQAIQQGQQEATAVRGGSAGVLLPEGKDSGGEVVQDAAGPAVRTPAIAGRTEAPDLAQINVPLAKRGNIDAQLDRYKQDQATAAKQEAKTTIAQRRTDKARAKELFAQHGEAIVAQHGAKFGDKETRKTLDSMVKWEPAKFIQLAETFEREQQQGQPNERVGSSLAGTVPAGEAGVDVPEAQSLAGQTQAPAAAQGKARISQDDQQRLTRAKDHADDLRSMSQDAGWSERGGRLLRDASGEATGRTAWRATADWFHAGMIAQPDAVRAAVDKAVEGKRLSAKESRTVAGMVEWLEAQKQGKPLDENSSAYDLERAGYNDLDADTQDAADTLDEFLNKTTTSEADGMRALGFTEEEIHAATGTGGVQQSQEGAGQADAGAAQEPGGVPGEAFSLASPTSGELRAREEGLARQREKEAEAQRQAEQKAQADAERGSFALTGSDRPADVAAARGQGGLFDQPAPQPEQPKPAPAKASEPAVEVSAAEADRILRIADHDALIDRLRDGTATMEDYRNGWAAFQKSRETLRAELAGMTKDAIFKARGAWFASRYKPDRKDAVVDAALRDMASDFTLGRSYSFGMGKDAQQQAVAALVERTTQADIDRFAKDVSAAREERTKRMQQLRSAVNDPQSLADFKEFIRVRGAGQMTDEQRVRYEDLVALDAKEQRAAEVEKKSTVQGVEAGTGMSLVETTHTRDKYPLFVVQMETRVEADTYKSLLAAAKRLGGWYSSFKGNGAIPGFQFKDKVAAEGFMAAGRGETVKSERVEQKQTANKNAAAQRLADMADKLEASANEELGRERLANTNKRAVQASSADAKARADLAFAQTLRNLADAIETGKATHLDGVRTKSHVDLLDKSIRTAKATEIRETSNSYADQLKREGETVTPKTVDYAKYPVPKGRREDALHAIRALNESKVSGVKLLIGRLEKFAAMSGDNFIKLPDGLAEQVVEKLKGTSQEHVVPWHWAEDIANAKRLKAMGIESPIQFRATLREFIQYRGTKPAADRAKELERSLVGQNVGFDFFPTPKAVADDMVEQASIEPGMSVLEPSAGNGNIAEAIRAAGVTPDVVELSSQLREVLEAKGFKVIGQDFLQTEGQYDRIVMNPPFSNGADMEHVRHAYALLKPGGRVVAIVGEGAFGRSDKQATAFREWLDEHGATVEKLPVSTFTDRTLMNTTGANARLVVIDKGGAKFSFAGQNAKTADKFALATALERLEAGEDADAVRQGTGWHFGADGRAKFEISDRDAKLKADHFPDAAEMIGQGKTVGDLLDHPKLFAAYPQLAGVEVDTKPGGGASFSAARDGRPARIRIGTGVPMRNVVSVLLHELQHGIQRQEGFATGTNLQVAGSRDAYFRSAGEVEARNVQTRQKMTDEERRGLSPFWTTDVADQDVIVQWNGKEVANAQAIANGPHVGMALRDVQAVVDRVSRVMKNLPRVHVLESPAALSTKDPAQKSLRDQIRAHGAWADVEGATHDGDIYLFASGLSGEARAEHVLATHEVTHYGLRGAIGKDLDVVLQTVWMNNPSVRQAAAALKERIGLGANLAAVEEVLADMLPADLAKLSGWRAVVKAVRDWFSRIGAKALAGRLDKLMKAGLSGQRKADLFVADLVTAAREWVRSGKGSAVFAEGTRLSGIPEQRQPVLNRTLLAWAGKVANKDRSAHLTPVTGIVERPAPALRLSGISDPIVMDIEHARHVFNTHPELGPEDIAALPDLLSRPRAILRHENGWRAIVDARDPRGYPLAVALTRSTIGGIKKVKVTSVSTMFGVENSASVIARGVKDGSLTWMPQKEIGRFLDLLSGTQFPMQEGKTPPPTHQGSDRTHFVLSDEAMVNFERDPKGDWAKRTVAITLPEDAAARLGGTQFSRAGQTAQAIGGPLQGATFAKAGEVLSDVLNTHGSFGVLKGLKTQYHKATLNPLFKGFWERSNAMAMESARAMSRPADLAPRILPKFDPRNMKEAAKALFAGRSDVQQADLTAVADALNAGTLNGGPSPLNGQVWTREALTTPRGQAVKNFDPREGPPPMGLGLTDKQADLYEEARSAVDASIDETAAATAWKLARQHVSSPSLREMISGNPQTAGVELDGVMEFAVGNAKDELALLKKDKAAEKTIQAQEKLVEDLTATRESIAAVFDKAEKLKQAGYMPLMRFGKYRIGVAMQGEDGQKVQYVARYESHIEANRARRDLERQFPAAQGFKVGPVEVTNENEWKLYKGVNPETVMLFAEEAGIDTDEVMQKWYREAVSNRSALRRMVHRAGVAGYSDDLPRVLASFITSNGKQAGYAYHLSDMQEMLQNPDMPGDVQEEAQSLLETIQEPNERGANMRGLMASWYLLGSVASAITNATQTVTMSLPWLSQFGAKGFSATEAAGALGKAYKMALAPVTMPADLKAAMKRAEQNGIVDSNEVFHLYAESMKPMLSKLGSGNLAYRARAFMTLWGAPFAMVETLNRRATFAAAYSMAKAQGKTENEASDFAARAVVETQGIYAKHNRPNWARGTLGAAALTFRQFSIAYVEMLARMAKSGPEGRKAALLATAILFSMAGLAGLPGEDDLLDIIDTVAQTLFGKPLISRMELRNALKDTLGKELGGFVNSGLSEFLPIDVSSRLGLGNLIPGTAILKPSTTDKTGEFLEAVGGVQGSFIQSLIQSVGMLAEGNVSGAARTAAPKAIGDVLKGAEMVVTGEARDRAGRKIVDTDLVDAFFQAIGFNPNVKAEAGKKAWDVTEYVGYIRKAESEIVGRWARGIADNDLEVIQDAQKRLADWNMNNPEAPIGISRQQIMQRLQSLRMERAGRIEKLAPKELRSRVREMVEED